MSKRRQQVIQPGRLALRAEGNDWNCYYAKPDTMDGALLLGSIKMMLVKDHPEVKELFKETMKAALAVVLVQIVGGKIAGWDEQPAAESERSGHG